MPLLQLYDLEAAEVSVVDRGANRRKIAFTKAEGTQGNLMNPTMHKRILETATDNEDSRVAALKSAGVSDDAIDGVRCAMRALDAFADQLPEQHRQHLTKALGFGEPAKPDDDLPPAAKARFEKAEQERQKLEKALNDERSLRLKREAEVRVSSDFSHLPGKKEDLVAFVLKAEQLGDVAKPILESLKTADAMIAKSLDAIGSGGSDTENDEDDPVKLIAKAAEEIRAKDPSLTPQQARVKAAEQHPELTRQHFGKRLAAARKGR